MPVGNKYELLESLGGYGIKVQRARAASGRVVLLHRLDTSSPASAQVLKLALQYALANPGSRALQDVVDDSGFTYVVTEDQPEYNSLSEWLLYANTDAGAAWKHDENAKALAEPDGAGKSGPGEFTKIFRPGMTGEREASHGESPRAASSESGMERGAVQQMETIASPASHGPKPGEFTEKFRLNQGAASPVQIPQERSEAREEVTEPPASPELGADKVPGEYTRLFRRAQAAGAPNPMAGMAGSYKGAVETGGNATQRLTAPDDLFPQRSTGGPSLPPPDGTSEYTRVIRGGGSGRDLATLAKDSIAGAATAKAVSPSPAPAEAEQPSVSEAPAEKAPAALPALPPPAAPNLPSEAKSAAEAGKRAPVGLIVLAVLFLVALALVLFFAFHR